MKKLLVFLLAALLIAAAGCAAPVSAEPAQETLTDAASVEKAPETADNSVDDGVAAADAPAAPSGALTEDELGIEVDGAVYLLRTDSAAILAALGDDCCYSEQVSCVYEGEDKLYEYDGLDISTVPVDGADVIEMFTLYDAAYSTLRGVRVGDTLESARAAYGENYFDDGYLTYSLTADPADIHSPRIQFEYEDGTITAIYIYSPSY